MIKVLIVEDDPMVAELNKRYLEQVEGYRIRATAGSVQDALKILDNQEIDLVLLDIFMPGSNGLELIREIRRKGNGVDVIVITAASDVQTIQQALRLGAVDYLVKPFEFERLKKSLTAYREEKRLFTEREALSQQELDQKVFFRERSTTTPELPKGLTRATMKIVWEHIEAMGDTYFSTEELARKVGISRVSMRKYLHFLGEIQLLDVEISYGSVGRPVYKYRRILSKQYEIDSYL
ncbi:response regulator [Ammoniphilus resinae]|uniref:Transcriptional regulatory protein n=1 Tax=Ammoniphilus resinae TaxID=861532 RepID=A0ABS4GWR2_9BACL|nr:response regulator [Ammoniphilus resinae]MBP1934715.1 CitB family two-component system response regulator MalR [Ammoniphilus resinae]